jgi:hypothetical protein
MGAMTIQGIAPGTAIITDRPELFWGMITSMWIGNLMLVVINLPLIGIWVSLLKVPYRILFPCILVFCCVGAYSIANSTFLIFMMAGFAVLGYVFNKLDCEGAPFLLSDGLGVGYGARPDADGIDAVYFVAQENYPVEFLELSYPVRLTTYAVHRDSGGAGLFLYSYSLFGWSDMGVNRKRVEAWLAAFDAALRRR